MVGALLECCSGHSRLDFACSLLSVNTFSYTCSQRSEVIIVCIPVNTTLAFNGTPYRFENTTSCAILPRTIVMLIASRQDKNFNVRLQFTLSTHKNTQLCQHCNSRSPPACYNRIRFRTSCSKIIRWHLLSLFILSTKRILNRCLPKSAMRSIFGIWGFFSSACTFFICFSKAI